MNNVNNVWLVSSVYKNSDYIIMIAVVY